MSAHVLNLSGSRGAQELFAVLKKVVTTVLLRLFDRVVQAVMLLLTRQARRPSR